jgi:hypothetical protein
LKDTMEVYMLIMLCYHYFPVILNVTRIFENRHTSIFSKDVLFQVHSVYLFGQQNHQFSFVKVITPS